MATTGTSPAQASLIFRRWFERFAEEANRAAKVGTVDAARLGIWTIRERTARGVDRHGRRFKAYRPATVRIRKKAGLTTGTVTLRFRATASMLDGLQVRGGLEFQATEVWFADRRAETLARFHIFGTRRMAARDFFGLHPSERKTIADLFRASLAAQVHADRRRRIVLVFSVM